TLNASGLSSTYFSLGSAGITATAGSIGGITITANTIQSTYFTLDSTGSITATNVNLSGTITATSGSFSGQITSSTGTIGGWSITASDLNGGHIRLVSSGLIEIKNGSDVIQVSLGEYQAGTYGLKAGSVILDASGLSGTGFALGTSGITATQGAIGGITLGADGLSTGDGGVTSGFKIASDGTITAKNVNLSGVITATSGSFTGQITSTSGTIGGWSLGSTTLSAAHITLDASGKILIANASGVTQLTLGEYQTGVYGLKAGVVTLNAQGLSGGNVVLGATATIGGITISSDGIQTGDAGATTGFKIGSNGTITAKNADLSGTITATAGQIAAWLIQGNTLQGGHITLDGAGLITIADASDVAQILLGEYQAGSFGLKAGDALLNASGLLGTGYALNASGITATKGEIGGISLSATGLSTGDGGVSSGFKIASDGSIVAKNVNLSGTITATSGSFRGQISSTSGTIGGWTLGSSTLSGSGITLASSGLITIKNGTTTEVLLGEYQAGAWGLKAGSVILNASGLSGTGFSVGASGVTATQGTIGGITLASDGIQTGDGGVSTGFKIGSNGSIVAKNVDLTGAIHATSGSFTGTITATSGSFTGSITSTSGTIGGWSLGTTTLSANHVTLDSSGKLTFADASDVAQVIIGEYQASTYGLKAGSVVLNASGLSGVGFGLGSAGIHATQGDIGGITIANDSLSTGDGGVTSGFALGSGGTLKAVGAILSGDLTATSGTFTGDVTITTGQLLAGKITINNQLISIKNGTDVLQVELGEYSAGVYGLKAGTVTLDATGLKGSGFTLSGSGVSASQGTIGGWNISGSVLSSDTITLNGGTGSITASGFTLDSSGLNLTSGTIGGWSLALGILSANHVTIDSTGIITIKDAADVAQVILGQHTSGEYGLKAGSVKLDSTGLSGTGFTLGTSGVTASQGTVGGWTLGTSSFSGGQITLAASGLITISNGTTSQVLLGEYTSGSFGLKAGTVVLNASGLSGTGFALGASGVSASQGVIGGWSLSANSLHDAGSIISLDSSAATLTIKNDTAAIQLIIGNLGSSQYGLKTGDIRLDAGGLSSTKFNLSAVDGSFTATKGLFGTSVYAISIDDGGIYSGTLGDTASPFGIFTQDVYDGPVLLHASGDAYFKGSVTVTQNSIIGNGITTTEVQVTDYGRVYAGTDGAGRIELRGPNYTGAGDGGGLYAFDSFNNPTVQISAQNGSVIITGAVNATGGTIAGNLHITGGGSNIWLVGDVTASQTMGDAGLYIFETGGGTGIIRLVEAGLQYSTDTGGTWQDAVRFTGMTANAITDGSLTITDTSGAADGIVVKKRATEESITFNPSDPTGYINLAHQNVNVLTVTSADRVTTYQPSDYDVNTYDGTMARTAGSTIPSDATVLVTYDYTVVQINSNFGIKIDEGLLEVGSSVTGTTLIGGGFLRVKGLDVGVFQSDNFLMNGNFNITSSDWSTAQTNAGKSIDGFTPYVDTDPYFGDVYVDRSGNTVRYGAAFWIPSKSDTTHDATSGMMDGFALVGFSPEGYLHNIYGYVNLLLGGKTAQWCQIEQDIYPIFNYTNGDGGAIPAEQHKDVVASAGFHWHSEISSATTVTMEVDELVPNYAYVDADMTTSFTPVWDRNSDTYNGLVYSSGWSFDYETYTDKFATGRNLAYGAIVTSNASLASEVDPNAPPVRWVVDNHFVKEEWATKTTGAGYHYVMVDLGSAMDINEIRVWHSMDETRQYLGHFIDVSVDGTTWTTLHDASVDGLWTESKDGFRLGFASQSVRYIRDWIEGYQVIDQQGNVVSTYTENQWLDIQIRHLGVAVTSTPGSYVEWTFTPRSRSDMWVGIIRNPALGKGHVEIDGELVGEFDEGAVMNMGMMDDYDLDFIEISAETENRLVPRKEHTIRVIFDDIPENAGKQLLFFRMKLEDFRAEPGLTTVNIVKNANISPRTPFAFYSSSVVP
ncbi:MAG TPA: hypothetical protein VFK03_01430, partial [Candidatus Saccharimonadales bacterium]|nr:hypothetical protein [Candidatus Saccharimonadales bacterium]